MSSHSSIAPASNMPVSCHVSRQLFFPPPSLSNLSLHKSLPLSDTAGREICFSVSCQVLTERIAFLLLLLKPPLVSSHVLCSCSLNRAACSRDLRGSSVPKHMCTPTWLQVQANTKTRNWTENIIYTVCLPSLHGEKNSVEILCQLFLQIVAATFFHQSVLLFHSQSFCFSDWCTVALYFKVI